ncbi:ATP-dependent Zn protease [Vibrio lentus]|uniref:putative ATP-dependent zinc protease n=1 Tax=Vibrio TaxID=662 RepID=UPI000C83CA1B|nr:MULTISPECIES: RimK/LysX family protein [Vibrio]MCC4818000.1 RimK/LysX family protein [Vibrio lentus]MDN2669060.1 RimK/LysX family protein [Vibrio sp. 14N.309.X.WAT.E.F5]PMG47217.1 ATP-dependent Zn protease [Vibrio lentus]PMG72938.1 ATP-dependent Zn protease [Vibrio lentus]PMJ85985.1 ATP-dependent Zn protease [Vibrio lentus]
MYNWKAIITLMLSGGLFACSTTTQVPVEPEQKPQIEQPVVDDSSKGETEATEPTEKPEEVKPVEPEVKPAPVEKPVEKARKTSDGKLILGEEEWVFVPGLKEAFKARVDTGATTSSISAVDIVDFERDGKDWVKFKIEHDGITTEEVSLPVERWVKIKQSSAEGTQRRAVVVASIQIGDLKDKTEFTLADRTHLSFPLLLGRSFFRDVAVVDVSQKYVQKKITK